MRLYSYKIWFNLIHSALRMTDQLGLMQLPYPSDDYITPLF
jgi:hypothetical protein